MRFNPKLHIVELSIIFGAIVLFYAVLPLQISVILFFICLTTFALLVIMEMSTEFEPESANAVVTIEDELLDEHYNT